MLRERERGEREGGGVGDGPSRHKGTGVEGREDAEDEEEAATGTSTSRLLSRDSSGGGDAWPREKLGCSMKNNTCHWERTAMLRLIEHKSMHVNYGDRTVNKV